MFDSVVCWSNRSGVMSPMCVMYSLLGNLMQTAEMTAVKIAMRWPGEGICLILESSLNDWGRSQSLMT